MGPAVGSAIDRVRKPEYTGENRCLPCTGVNLAIGAALAVSVAGGTILADASAWLAAVTGLLVLGASVTAIALRGYLVPYTPQLTKRYLPERVLARFDHHEPAAGIDAGSAIDVEEVLLAAGVLRERPDEDLELVPDFEAAWFAELDEVGEAAGRETLAALLGADPADLTFDEYGEAFVAADGGMQVGRWESRAAFRADIAAARILHEYVAGWESATARQRSQLLSGLRLFLEECPACRGPVRFGQEVVESCCRSIDVIAVTCQDCEARLFEMDAPEPLVE